jgi:hypothetical protein
MQLMQPACVCVDVRVHIRVHLCMCACVSLPDTACLGCVDELFFEFFWESGQVLQERPQRQLRRTWMFKQVLQLFLEKHLLQKAQLDGHLYDCERPATYDVFLLRVVHVRLDLAAGVRYVVR